MRSVSWPGGGRELGVKVHDPQGKAIQDDLSQQFRLQLEGEFDMLAERAQLVPGFTAVLLPLPESEAERRTLVSEVEAFALQRPPQEAIAIFLWRAEVEQLVGFTRDRDRLRAQLGALPSFPASATRVSEFDAIRIIEHETRSVAGQALRVMRAAVIADSSVRPVPTSIPVVAGLEGASAAIDAFAESSIYRLALCASPSALESLLEVIGLAGLLPLSLSESLPEEASSACDISAIGPGARSYPETIELLFDAQQRETYDERVQALSKADFGLSVRLGQGEPVSASAHLRGKGTLGCIRKSYTLALDGPGRHLLPDSRSDEFYLLSMCADDRYVQQFTANQLLAEQGLFPLAFRYVHLKLDGESQGVYLLLEKAREELVRDNSRVQGVLRRRFTPPDTSYETKYDDKSIAFESRYQELVSSAGATPAAAAESIDLPQYLRFLAVMSAYQNGDYIDEIWITAAERAEAQGPPTSWFSTMAWDNDDLFSECHYTGKYAFEDPHELVYCAEAPLDALLLGDPEVYDQYVQSLETLLNDEIRPERFDEAVETTASAIMPFLAQPEIAGAMVRLIEDNPGAVDPVEAQRDVRAELDALKSQYRARRELLLQRIQDYRGRL